MLQWKLFRSKITAVTWLVLITILFFWPGSALPKQNWMSEIQIENWIHVIFFAILIFLWRSAFNWKISSAIYLLLALLYGVFIEFAQHQWVPHRSFELDDLMWDLTGSVLGLVTWAWAYRKK